MYNFLILIAGFTFLVKGADYLIDGATSLARRFNISDLFVGLTIIAFGTSTPELVINIVSSLHGSTDIAIGNVLGSNIANVLLILGITAMISPLIIKHDIVWREIPLSIMATLLLIVMVNDPLLDHSAIGLVSRLDGLLLSILFFAYLYYVYRVARSNRSVIKHARPLRGPIIAVLMIILGIVGLSMGGVLVVEAAKNIAQMFGWSQALVGLTFVAVGTSLPELMTSVVAALKHKADIAIGNVVGSNILNISWALGFSAVIRPIPFQAGYNMDIIILILVTVLLFLWLSLAKTPRLNRKQGLVMILLYLVYLATIIFRE